MGKLEKQKIRKCNKQALKTRRKKKSDLSAITIKTSCLNSLIKRQCFGLGQKPKIR